MAADPRALVVLLLPMGLMVAILVHQARARKRAKRPMWEAVAAFARRHGLSVGECPGAPYGVPEAYGDLHGRPFHLRVIEGKASRLIQTSIGFATRVPHRAEVYVTRGSVSKYAIGSPRWHQAFLGPPPRSSQVRITSPVPRAVAKLQGKLGPEGEARLRRLVDGEGFYAVAFRSGKSELRAEFLVGDSVAIERWAADLLAATEAVESCVDPDALEELTPIVPFRTWRARWTDTGIQIFLIGIAGFLAALPLLSGGVPWEAWAFLSAAALLLAVIAGSRIWASRLGPEERAILAEFANR